MGTSLFTIVFEDPNFLNREYETFSAYGQSKTASILFSLELDNIGKDAGVRSYSLHPGVVSETELSRNVPREDLVNYGIFDKNGDVINDPAKGLKSLSQGASTTVWCATCPQLNDIGGVYCENADIAEPDNSQADDSEESMDGSTIMKDIMPYALDEATARKLWTLSEELTGVKLAVSM